jgi:hypothetical protein
MSEEQKVPSKEEVMTFLIEQIEVKELQVKLQELNTKLAKARAEELQAISFVAQMTNPRTEENEMVPHTLTQEDLDENPELVEDGYAVGDSIVIPKPVEEKKSRTLKKKA